MPVKKTTELCEIDECYKTKYHTYRYCNMHQKRQRLHGDPNKVVRIHGDHEARFWSYVRKFDSCWIWTGPSSKSSREGAKYYGYLEIDGKNIKAHRYSYKLRHGEISDDLVIDHVIELCKNTMCVNPDHLEQVTLAENTRRYFRSKTHCKNGHEYTPENTYIRKDNNTRQCRTCSRLRR